MDLHYKNIEIDHGIADSVLGKIRCTASTNKVMEMATALTFSRILHLTDLKSALARGLNLHTFTSNTKENSLFLSHLAWQKSSLPYLNGPVL